MMSRSFITRFVFNRRPVQRRAVSVLVLPPAAHPLGRCRESKHDRSIAANTLKREFTAGIRNSVWFADITYIPTAAGWVYLATVIDFATRMLDGRSMAGHMRTELVESALLNSPTS